MGDYNYHSCLSNLATFLEANMTQHTIEEMESRIRGLETILHQVDTNLTSMGVVSMSTRLLVKGALESSDENYSLRGKI